MSDKERIHKASRAISNLYIFAAIVAMLEGGTISIESNVAAQRIIRICQEEQQKCLRRYDLIVARER